MKKIELYQCDFCKKAHKDKDKILSCEQEHCSDEDLVIVTTQHMPDLSRYGFPEFIILGTKNENGFIAKYKFVSEYEVGP